MSAKKEFGDFQTPLDLAQRVVKLVEELFGKPDTVIEPTAGLGSFLKASVEQWGSSPDYEGYEINRDYVVSAQRELEKYPIRILHRDFFTEDWRRNLLRPEAGRLLIIGNPPWVTNSDLGLFGSSNLPEKSNFLGLRGMDARTGKSNFDIAEWMLIRLIESLPKDGALAMLCKTMTARKVLRHLWKTDGGREGSRLFHINAKAEFDVAVDACLFFITGKRSVECNAIIFSDLTTRSDTKSFGFLDGDLVSDIDTYKKYRHLDGGSGNYTWRSGIKHDAARVMEFSLTEHHMTNGFGETVDLEDDYVYPLLKSSDLGNGRVTIRKAVLVPQQHTGDETDEIADRAPATWEYLVSHAEDLDARRSSIYRNRPRFSIFGVGGYSFAPWKVATSGLYKKISFVVIGPKNGRPVMVDDTCYSIPCYSKEEAYLLHDLLSSDAARQFLQSLVFFDSKRPITIDVLRRISFVELARHLGRLKELTKFTQTESPNDTGEAQMRLIMEPNQRYRTRRCCQGTTARG